MIVAQSRTLSYCWGELNDELYYILKQHPGVPYRVGRLARMLGRNELQIEAALEEIEGPVASTDPGAFIHIWRSTGEAIYLP